MEKATSEFDLPGFRFHPTEEELLDFYLRNIVCGKKLNFDIIGTLNLYRHDPWDLPGLAKIGEREWYFFVPRDRKHSSGGRPNRTTENGFWKATGSDRQIRSVKDPKRVIGLKKTLVFYRGRAPRGSKTDWVMNEYRMPDSRPPPKEDIVLCKIYRKATSMKVLEQRAAMEEDNTRITQNFTTPVLATVSSPEVDCSQVTMPSQDGVTKDMKMEYQKEIEDYFPQVLSSSMEKIPQLQLPKHNYMDFLQDPLIPRSPWLDTWAHAYANVLNF